MTIRVKGCTVTFNRDIREDDAESLVDAIWMLKWVANVELVESSSVDWFARNRIRHESEARLHEAIRRIMRGPPALGALEG